MKKASPAILIIIWLWKLSGFQWVELASVIICHLFNTVAQKCSWNSKQNNLSQMAVCKPVAIFAGNYLLNKTWCYHLWDLFFIFWKEFSTFRNYKSPSFKNSSKCWFFSNQFTLCCRTWSLLFSLKKAL